MRDTTPTFKDREGFSLTHVTPDDTRHVMPDTLTIKQTASRLNKSVRTIRRYLSDGKFPNVVKDEQGRVDIPVSDIVRFETGQPPQQQVTPDVVTDDTEPDDRNVPQPTPEQPTHAETPGIADNGRDDVTGHDIVKSDVRFLIQIDLSWFRFMVIRKAGDPSLIRDGLAAMGRGLRRIFKK